MTLGEAILDATYEKVSGSLGSLLLLWSAIERSARTEIIRATGSLPKSAHGIAASLRTWLGTVPDVTASGSLSRLLAATLFDQLHQPLSVRNGLCHGLVGISSAREEAPAKLTWEINGEEHCVSWEELQTSFSWLSKVPHAIAMISATSTGNPVDRSIDRPENRGWWLSEFGLKLP